MTIPLWAAFLFWYAFGVASAGVGIIAVAYRQYARQQAASASAQKGRERV